MMAPTRPPRPGQRLVELMKWVLPVLAAGVLACSGTVFCVFGGLASRGELTLSLLGTDFRLWSVGDRQQTGLALQRAYGVQREGRACTHSDITFLYWRPALQIENVSNDDCG